MKNYIIELKSGLYLKRTSLSLKNEVLTTEIPRSAWIDNDDNCHEICENLGIIGYSLREVDPNTTTYIVDKNIHP